VHILISPEGKEIGRYDKIHMVPFGEYLPFPFSILYRFLGKVIGAVGDFTPAEKSHVFLIPQGGFGVLICYEIIFPELSRRLAHDGANLLVTITNDAWFGRTSAPYQHLSMATFRAVENRRYIARSANTGISGFVDITGKIIRTTDIFRPAYLAGEVGLGKNLTFYTKYGDVFSWACLFISAMFLWRITGRLKISLLS
jgi:apolipoprotein N-acyltransferase